MYKRGKAMFAQEVVCAPPSSIAALSVAFNAAGFLSNPVTMMGMLDYNSHNDGEIVDDDDDNALISLR